MVGQSLRDHQPDHVGRETQRAVVEESLVNRGNYRVIADPRDQPAMITGTGLYRTSGRHLQLGLPLSQELTPPDRHSFREQGFKTLLVRHFRQRLLSEGDIAHSECGWRRGVDVLFLVS